MQENRFRALVLDSGAFIAHASILGAADEYYTIEQVVSEVRDKYAREAFDQFPFEIKIRSPTSEAIEAVSKFAKATGDFSRLAQTDLLLIALVYDLQKEISGLDRINIAPLINRNSIIDVNEKRVVGVNVSSEPCKFFSTPGGCNKGNDCLYRHPGDIERSEFQPSVPKTEKPLPKSIPEKPREVKHWNVPKTGGSFFENDARFPALGSQQSEDDNEEKMKIKAIFDIKRETVEAVEEVESNHSAEENDQANHSAEENDQANHSAEEDDQANHSAQENEPVVLAKEPLQDKEESGHTSESIGSRIHVNGASLVSHVDDTEDDDGEWITSESLNSFEVNLSRYQPNDSEEDDRSQYAACCTGDYSMQNVLLQMGLQLLSYDNKRITTLRVWTRRCKDCFSVCHDDTRLFCPDCGHPSLARVPVIVLKGGIVRIGDAPASKSLRGTIYPIGKNDDLLLCEDQLKSGKWKQRLQKMRRAKKEGCIFGDVSAESLGLEYSKNHQNDYLDQIVVGYGRKNPNAMKGRERRGKKKQKKVSRY